VQRVAQKYVPLDDLVIVAVGDGAKIRSVLAEFGTIEEWDSKAGGARPSRAGPAESRYHRGGPAIR
jgi:hypothetical protein